jgi:hypothetical protein
LKEDICGCRFQKLTLARLSETIKTSLTCVQEEAEDKQAESSTSRFNGDFR